MAEELLSTREAAERLGLDRESARLALAGGLAGPSVRVRSAVLYEAARVDDLAARGLVPLDALPVDALPEDCRTGMMVVRLARRTDLRASRGDLLALISTGYRMSPWTRMLIRNRVATRRSVPLAATLGGFVVLGADITDVEHVGRREARLRLTDAGSWFETWRAGRFEAGRGSRWQWWDATGEAAEEARRNRWPTPPGTRIAG